MSVVTPLQDEGDIRSLHFSENYTLLWIGDSEGFVHVVDVKSGGVVWLGEERLCDVDTKCW